MPTATNPVAAPRESAANRSPIPHWLQAEVAAYDLEIIPPPKSILDIGANIGAYTLRCSAKWPGVRIDAFEPVRETFADLNENVAAISHAWDRLFTHNMAVRKESGTEPIFIGDQPVTCSFHQRGRQTEDTEMVQCLAADMIRGAELVKIDTEGCEVEILEGLDLRLTRAVVVEYHSLADIAMIKAIVGGQGFNLLDEAALSAEHGVLKFSKDPGVMLPQPVAAPRESAAVKSAVDSHPQPQPRKVFLAVAGHYGFNDLLFVQSLIALTTRTKVAVQIGWSCDPSVERARNILTASFLETDCTHILFVDADIGFTADDVARISSHNEPVVGGMYPLKTDAPDVAWCGNGLQPGEAPIREDGLSQVKYIGTGFLCIRRDVFGILAQQAAVEPYHQDFPPHRKETAFWFQRVFNRRFLTEDWNFCQLCLDQGLRIYGDSQVVLRHAGRVVWPLAIQRGNPFVPPPVAASRESAAIPSPSH